jgi:hypothetical protein
MDHGYSPNATRASELLTYRLVHFGSICGGLILYTAPLAA